jgi:hypothetical protein
MHGYLSAAYAASLADHGTPRLLARSQGWVLRRPIDGTPWEDACGCYPLFACQDWSRLADDLSELGDQIVSFSAVADPFGGYDLGLLGECFPQLARPFKEHFIIDLERDPETYISRHHLREARRALRKLSVERCDQPAEVLADWIRLYAILVERHGISGIPAFSEASFAAQLRVPGIVAFRAAYQGETVAIFLWYEQGEVAYYHLAAHSDEGYRLGASYALLRLAIDFFAASGPGWLDLGGSAGLGDADDGLAQFKRGWATGTRTAYLCGRIFDDEAYDELIRRTGMAVTSYFPAYRFGEFGRRPAGSAAA